MIRRLYCVITENTDPCRNLALEELLFHQAEEDMCILYLWQNRKTVVVGRNQNVFRECLYNRLQQEKGQLVRRLSGGGAVFHDLGNLNFTFLLNKKNYNLDRQFRVILRALDKLGINAEQTGRNDLTIEGRKFSGNAFYENKGRCCHHGTLMVSVNLDDLTKYLNVSREKLKSNGVNSVRSRVTNIIDYKAGLTVRQMMDVMVEAFEEEYGLVCNKYPDEMINLKYFRALEQKYCSREWTWGRNIKFTHQLEKKFPWGAVRMEVYVEQGIVKDLTVFTDSLQTEWPRVIEANIQGCYYDDASICAKIDTIFQQSLIPGWLCNDLKILIRGLDFVC